MIDYNQAILDVFELDHTTYTYKASVNKSDLKDWEDDEDDDLVQVDSFCMT